DLAAASDSGNATDNITKYNTPTLKIGRASCRETVKLYDTDGTTSLGSSTADASGNWSIASSLLADGAHTLTAKQTDVAGNVSAASTSLTVTIDTAAAAPSAPDLAAASDSGNATDNITKYNTPTLSGNGAERAEEHTPELKSLAKSVCSNTADANSNWSIVSSLLADGPRALPAYPTRRSSDLSAASTSLTVTIDTAAAAPSAPDLAAASDSGNATDNITKYNTPTLSGNGAE